MPKYGFIYYSALDQMPQDQYARNLVPFDIF